jgi:hypothetical protein
MNRDGGAGKAHGEKKDSVLNQKGKKWSRST